MGVAVEVAVAQKLLQEDFRNVLGELRPVEAQGVKLPREGVGGEGPSR